MVVSRHRHNSWVGVWDQDVMAHAVNVDMLDWNILVGQKTDESECRGRVLGRLGRLRCRRRSCLGRIRDRDR